MTTDNGMTRGLVTLEFSLLRYALEIESTYTIIAENAAFIWVVHIIFLSLDRETMSSWWNLKMNPMKYYFEIRFLTGIFIKDNKVSLYLLYKSRFFLKRRNSYSLKNTVQIWIFILIDTRTLRLALAPQKLLSYSKTPTVPWTWPWASKSLMVATKYGLFSKCKLTIFFVAWWVVSRRKYMYISVSH